MDNAILVRLTSWDPHGKFLSFRTPLKGANMSCRAWLTSPTRGGGFNAESSSNSKCNRGYKVFCCDAGDWKDVINGCHWTSWLDSLSPFKVDRADTSSSGGSCKSEETSVSNAHSADGEQCTIFHPTSNSAEMSLSGYADWIFRAILLPIKHCAI